MSTKTIVVIEDEPDILAVLRYNLEREGFLVCSSFDGKEGLELTQKILPDLVLLDLMLPSIDGLEICRQLKNNVKTQHTPIIMVTAKDDESDIVLGLGLGADDYIAKPFSPKELVARVKAVLRREIQKNNELPEQLIKVNNLAIDLQKHQVTLNNIEIKLTATEFRLLQHMAKNSGRVFSREQLLDHNFTNDMNVVDRNVDVHIRSIRKKLGDEQEWIETIRGIGYRFKDFKQS